MLSRVADSIYWMSRYIERAENLARFVDVNLQLSLDAPSALDHQWQPLVSTTADDVAFGERYGSATQENVVQFLCFDGDNPNSILSCLRAARENARTVREAISSEMWLQINRFYLMVTEAARNPMEHGAAPEFYESIKLASHLFNGLKNATMTHGEGWHFGRVGRMLERADKTSRILDMKYYILLRSVDDVGTPFDDIQWAALLRSASAFEMYRKRHGRISPRGVVEFLLLDREFPRAVQYSLLSAQDSLHAISGTPVGRYQHTAERLLGQLCSDLAFVTVDEVISAGVHEYIDELQVRLNGVGDGILHTFFALKAPGSMKDSGRTQAVGGAGVSEG